MPELPEVETVRKGLENILHFPAEISRVRSSSKPLRFQYPRGLKQKLAGAKILKISRRAKYLIFDLGEKSLICHLGMTGNWREDDKFIPKNHDHFNIQFSDGMSLVYNDVRRFGYLDLLPSKDLNESRWFSKLGPEPFVSEGLSVDWMKAKLKGRTASIKSLIMNQEVVVGVGNIYASEALFLAGIFPKKPAGKLTSKRIGELVDAIEKVIQSAISSGGSTIRDFKNAGGSQGYFQTQLNVYGRAGQLCRKCDSPIQSAVVAGRSTFWCSKCQK